MPNVSRHFSGEVNSAAAARYSAASRGHSRNSRACSNVLRLFGLDKHAAQFTRQVTTNLLHGFADGPAAAKYSAHDNLATIHDYVGDPIGNPQNLQ